MHAATLILLMSPMAECPADQGGIRILILAQDTGEGSSMQLSAAVDVGDLTFAPVAAVTSSKLGCSHRQQARRSRWLGWLVVQYCRSDKHHTNIVWTS